MPYVVKISDALTVEYTMADAYSGPNRCFSKLNVNTNSIFFRINGGEWIRTRLCGLKVKEYLSLCETEEDVLSLLES